MVTLGLVELTQVLIMGLLVGTVYAPLVLGFNIIYKSSRVVNFAQAELLLVGVYFIYTFAIMWLKNLILGIALAIIMSAVLGALIERICLRPLIGKSVFALIMVTIGLGSVLQGFSQVVWGVIPLPSPKIFPVEPIKLGPYVIPMVYLGSATVSALFIIVLIVFYNKTKLGVSMRAAADDQQAAMAMGVSIPIVFSLAWMLSAIASTVTGLFISNIYGFISSAVLIIILRVFTAAIVGGLDSIGGAIVGALLIGVSESVGGLVEPFIGPGFRDIAPLLFALVFLLFKPYGLFGSVRIERL